MKYIFTLCMLFTTTLGFSHDILYYSMSPKLLQRVIARCPEHHPQGISCDQLNQTAIRMNSLAVELRMDPQAYGQQILAMQETIAKQANLLQEKSTDISLRDEVQKNNAILRERLIVIKWLESPEDRS